MENSYVNRQIEPALDYSGNILPHKKWEWLLFIFITCSLTIGYNEGASMIVKLYGMLFAGLFFLYFLFHKKSLKVPPEVILYALWIIWSLVA